MLFLFYVLFFCFTEQCSEVFSDEPAASWSKYLRYVYGVVNQNNTI